MGVAPVSAGGRVLSSSMAGLAGPSWAPAAAALEFCGMRAGLLAGFFRPAVDEGTTVFLAVGGGSVIPVVVRGTLEGGGGG